MKTGHDPLRPLMLMLATLVEMHPATVMARAAMTADKFHARRKA